MSEHWKRLKTLLSDVHDQDHYLSASKIRNVDLAKQELGVNLS